MACEHVAEGSVVGAREAAVEVLAVLRHHERRSGLERRHAHDRDRRDASRELARVELIHEPYDGRDRRVLAAVDPAEQAKVRAVPVAGGLEAGKLEPGEEGVVEAERAVLDHPASLAPSPAQAKWQAATCSAWPTAVVSAGSSSAQIGVC